MLSGYKTVRKYILAFAAAASLLGGCQSLAALTADPAQGQTLADAEKGLTVAHLAYQAAGVSLKAAADSGVLHGPDAATARALYDKVGAALDAADAADALANAQGVADAVADADALLFQINALIPK